MSKTILNLLMASLLLIFVAGCGGGGGGDSVSYTDPNTNSTPPIPNQEPTDSNLAPVAVAGDDQNVTVGNQVDFDGIDSYDLDENYPLTYAWEIFFTPDGSDAVLSAYALDSTFHFTPDLSGEYRIKLVVTDSLGMESVVPYVVVVNASDPDDQDTDTTNLPPVADAGGDYFLPEANTAVQLDGRGSHDPDGDSTITYAWSITQTPQDSSSAYLENSNTAEPILVADTLGTYRIELIVTDNYGLTDIDEAVVTSENVAPVANAGIYTYAIIGNIFSLDGSGSWDANEDALTYSWNIAYKPNGSQTELNRSGEVDPDFTPDTWGSYIISLMVNDGELDSKFPSNVEILAIYADDLNDPFIKALINTVIAINDLEDSDFYNPNMRNALISKIFVVIKSYRYDGYSDAMLAKLKDDIAGKMDGCALGDEPDGNDWILNCTAQRTVYQRIGEAIAIFEDMSALNTQ